MVESIENKILQITVRPSGAELVSVRNKKNDREYLWQGDPQFWARRAPVLFPIVGKANNNQIKAEGQVFDMPQHGLARNSLFSLTSKTENSLTYTLFSNEESLKNYPYQFKFDITYTLEENKVNVSYRIENTDDKKIWFSVGGHPAFNCPLLPGEKFADYYIEFEQEENAERHLLSEGLFNGKTETILDNSKELKLSEELFEKDAIVLKNLKSSKVYLKSKRSDYFLEFSFEGFPYFGIWTKGGGSPFICLEPWYGLADTKDFKGELNQKEGILSLEKGEVFESTFSFRLGDY
ncbi:aldose 1-epimerase family protein [Cytophagaceae bacterium ABcell3]|nr:aldose 1-epimerase family protein [Cytophagaceae bacterium ABcell3]